MSLRRAGVVARGALLALLVAAPARSSGAVASVSLDPSTITGGSATATVTLSAPAPAGGEAVDLTSSLVALAASTPTVVVPGGATSATFVVGTNAFYRPFSGLAFDVTITAASRAGGSASAVLHVTSQPVPGPFTGGTRSTDQQARDGNICGSAFGSGSASARGILFSCQFEVPGEFSVCRFLQECEFGCQEERETITLGFPVTVRDFCRAGPPAPISLSRGLVVGGAAVDGAVLFGEPAPQFSELQISSDPPMVSPIGNTPIPQGATSAPFTVSPGEVAVPTFLPLNLMLWLSPRFRYDADFLAVVPAPGAPAPAGPLAVFSVSVEPTSVAGGQSQLVVATVTLNGVAPAGGALVSLSSDGPAATVPQSVRVEAGRTNAFVGVTTASVTQPTPVAIGATFGGVTRSATLTVNPPAPPVKLLALSLDPPGVVGGSSSTGTVIIDAPAPSGGTSIPLRSSHAIATVPASVVVPAGATRATFTVTTSAVATVTEVTISGSSSFESAQAFLRVSPTAPTVSVSSLSLSPTALVGGSGNTSTGTVTLTAAAPSGGANVNLSRDSAPVLVPIWITVPAGATSATFTVSTLAVTSSTVATITAGYGAATRTATLTVNPSGLASLTVSPSTVVGGSSSTGTVTLSSPAPAGGAVVTLSDVGDVTTVPASVTVPAGATSATFGIATQPVAETFNANIFARLAGVEKQALLIVQPSASPAASLSAVTVSPASVVGGASSQGTVTLTAGAPAGGAAVALSSSSAAASVPASVMVPAGATSASFTVGTTSVAASTAVTLTATASGVSRTTTLTVTPAATTVSTAPSLVSPANRARVAQPIAFDWSDVANAARYELQIDDSSTFTAPLTRSVTVDGVSQASVSGLPAARLFWRVRGIASSGAPGPFSSSRRFDAQASATTGPSLAALAVSPTTVTGGGASQGTVTLTGAAPSGGAAVTLSSSNPAVASAPASVTVPAGATSAGFTVSTSAVTASTTVTLSGSFAGASRSATLTVAPSAPAQAYTLTVTATGRSGERVLSSPAGISVPVGSSGSASFPAGTAITLSVSNGRDAIWSGACSSGGSKARTCTFTITGNASVTGNVQ